MTEKEITTTKGLVKADFSFWVGKYMNKFYDGFEQKKLYGNKCSKCKNVFVPPRKICGICNELISFDQHWEELSDTGVLKNFTATAYKVTDRRARKSKNLKYIGMVEIDGTNSGIIYPLEMEPEEIKIGMKVKIKWKENPKGDPSDIEGFIPV